MSRQGIDVARGNPAAWTRFRISISAVLALLMILAANPVLAAAYDWPQLGEGDWIGSHSGSNTQETAITPGNVNTLQRLFQVPLPSIADSTPVELSGVSTTSGIRDLLFLTTVDGHILALDAHTGTQIWAHQYGPSPCSIPNPPPVTHPNCYTTSSPAIDPSRQYVYSYGLDGYVHKYQVGDGTEISGGGWPAVATRKTWQEKSSPALSIATTPGGTYLYVANGGYPGDAGDYQGHITAINLATGSQHVFNTLCSNQPDVHFVQSPGTPDCPRTQSAVWARPGVVYDPDTNRIYFSTGNGDYNPASFDWGDSVLALNPDGTGSGGGMPLDSYTPTNYPDLDASDTDLGSTAPAVLPASAVPAASRYKHLGVQSGKDGYLRLLNLDNLSIQGGAGHTGGELASVQFPTAALAEVLSQPGVWVNPADGRIWIIITNDKGLVAYTLTVDGSGMPGLAEQWSTEAIHRVSLGSSPLVANGVLFDARPHLIEARDPVSGKQLWSDGSIGDVHWSSPMVANGVLYISDESGQLTAYGLPVTGTGSSGASSVSSTQQYTLTGSNGSSWVDLDPTTLSLTLTPATNSTAVIGGNADLWTSSPGYNQDLGIFVSGGSFGAGQLVAWKESGGSGTFSPNAAHVQTVLSLQGATTYTVRLQWKSNRPDPGTIWAGAGPIGGQFSPTRLTAELTPTSSGTSISTAASTQQYTLSGSNGSSWVDLDPSTLALTLTPATTGTAVLSGNADLWTSSPGYNQDLGIVVSGGAFGAGQLVAWKESGGSGTFSPNAAYVHAVVPLSAGATYTVRLQWKSNRPDPGTIWAGAGPIGGQFSPTRLTAEIVPGGSTTSLTSTVSTQQYTLTGSNGASWVDMDANTLQLTLTPSRNVNAVVGGNADLWTSSPGYNQDLGIIVSGGSFGASQLVAWKESGGSGTFSPNAAYVHTVLPLAANTTYVVRLQWKSNRPDPGTIWAGAGPIGGQFSPTRLTAELIPSG